MYCFVDFYSFWGIAESTGNWPFLAVWAHGSAYIWLILKLRSQKCKQWFLGPRISDFRPQTSFPVGILIEKDQKGRFVKCFSLFLTNLLWRITLFCRDSYGIPTEKLSSRDQVGCSRSFPGYAGRQRSQRTTDQHADGGPG